MWCGPISPPRLFSTTRTTGTFVSWSRISNWAGCLGSIYSANSSRKYPPCPSFSSPPMTSQKHVPKPLPPAAWLICGNHFLEACSSRPFAPRSCNPRKHNESNTQPPRRHLRSCTASAANSFASLLRSEQPFTAHRGFSAVNKSTRKRDPRNQMTEIKKQLTPTKKGRNNENETT